MKLNHIFAAAALALAGTSAFAYNYGSSFDTDSQTYEFGVSGITAPTSTFTFKLDANYGATPGLYNMVGSLSATNFTFSSVVLNGTSWDLTADAKGKFRFADIELTSTIPLTLTVTGTKYGTGAGVFSGELVMAPVPEPETYALMLGGLGVIGFLAVRRRQD